MLQKDKCKIKATTAANVGGGITMVVEDTVVRAQWHTKVKDRYKNIKLSNIIGVHFSP